MTTPRRRAIRANLLLRIYPAALALTLVTLSTLADTPQGLSGPDWWGDSTAAVGAAASLVAAIHPVRLARFIHFLAAELAIVSRCLFIVLGWAGNWGFSTQVLGASVWATLAVATVTIYLAAVPYVALDHPPPTLGAA
jgi:hypothetical protein